MDSKALSEIREYNKEMMNMTSTSSRRNLLMSILMF